MAIERSAEETVEHFKSLKEKRYAMYVSNVNQFRNVINNQDYDGIRELYGGKPNSYFRRVLELLNEPTE